MDPFEPPLDKPRHLRYWQRCLRTLLPHHYTSMDSTRLSLAFFIITSIDLLSTPPDSSSSTTTTTKPLLTPSDRRNLRRWVLSCQHPDGGFCGSPTHVLPRAIQTADHDSENPHIGGTYFALLVLAILADDDDDDEQGGGGAFAGVDRVRTLRWLRRLQRPEDGSFGELVYDPPAFSPTDTTNTENNEKNKSEPIIAGGRDFRYCYLAASVRWMLRGDLSPEDEDYVEDIDVDALVAHIHRGQTYDGGFAESWQHESHAGYAYCAVAALSMLGRPLEGTTAMNKDGTEQTLYDRNNKNNNTKSEILQKGVGDMQGLVSFLMSRQFVYLPPITSTNNNNNVHNDDDDDDDEDPATANFRFADLSLEDNTTHAQHIGFNGRCNKIADTCYTWWTLGSLATLGLLTNSTTLEPASLRAQRAFLLEKTQHIIGGFGKNAGSPPDVGHACLGLAALSTMGDPGLKKLDPALCVSVETVGKVEKARKGLLKQAEARRKQQQQQHQDSGDNVRDTFEKSLVDMAVSIGGGERPAWLDAIVA